MRILVTGANGMLGSSVRRIFCDHDLILTGSTELDVRNMKQVLSFAGSKPDLILHLAAETDLTRAEFNPSDTYLTNYTGSQNMVQLAKTLDIPIVYISTAMIFDGKKKNYSEEDRANPTNHYGRSKYYGELEVASYKKHYIVRSGWAFGGGPEIDKKFVSKVFKKIQAGVKKLYAVKDVYGNPTYTIDFAKTLKNIVEAKIAYGTYHCSGKDKASRYDVLKAFVNFLGLSKKIEIVPVTINEYLALFPSNLPYIRNEVLSTKKIEKTGLLTNRDWQSALYEYSKEFKSLI